MLLLLSLLTQNAAAADILINETIQGGLSIDGSGTSSPYNGTPTFFTGDDLRVDMPSTGRIKKLYLVLYPKPAGFPADLTNQVSLNQKPLSETGTLVKDLTAYKVYELNPTTVNITTGGSYGYRESGAAEQAYQTGFGVSGAVLAALYEDTTKNGRRHIIFGAGDGVNQTVTANGAPTAGTTGQMAVSFGVNFMCSDQQGAKAIVNGVTLSDKVGGRDDGFEAQSVCNNQDWNSLYTQGTFGFDNQDTWIGTDGDRLSEEPATGAALNSRLSDELWIADYNESGSVAFRFENATPTGTMGAFAAVIEMDTDEDGLRDARDNCPRDANPLQADLDDDDFGDLCDPDADDDDFVKELDCNDLDPNINPGRPEIWYDGIDRNCDDKSDYDKDADGFEIGSHNDDPADGGGDCDDDDSAIYPGASEIPDDGIDQDCDQEDLCDADGDGFDKIGCSLVGDDCDDTDASIYPDAPEISDGEDNDCNGYDEVSDTDGDGLLDEEELDLGTDPESQDSDDDGVPDGYEIGEGAAPPDSDGDTIKDPVDPDDDTDGILTKDEILDYDYTEPGAVPPDNDGDGTPNHLDEDSDDDGWLDEDEGLDDTDGDGLPDFVDPDSDNDGIPDADELDADTDGDGADDRLDDDDDGDGIGTRIEGTSDPDEDGLPAYLDDDSDNDGIPDSEESSEDLDCDGLPGFADADETDGPCMDPAVVFAGGSCDTSGGSLGWTTALVGLVLLRRRRG